MDSIATWLVIGTAVAAMVLYTRAAGRARIPVRLRSQAAFLSGVVVCAVGATMPDDIFSLHVAGHLLMAVLGPILIALGAPVAVATASYAPARRLVGRLRGWWWARLVSQPLTVWALFNGGLVALYLTPLYHAAQANWAVHGAVHLHMVGSGLLFGELAVGSTPLPSRPSFPARLAAVGFSIPVHGLLGLAVLSLPTATMQTGQLVGPAGLADQQVGGWMLWVVGDLVLSALLVVALLAWSADEERRERVALRGDIGGKSAA